MRILETVLPFVSTTLTFVFAVLVFERWTRKRHDHLLLWGIGLVMYAVGGTMEALYGIFGWNPLVFRLWYLCGAVLVAAWLGLGTAYLLMRGKSRRIAHALLALLTLGSLYAAVKVFTAQLDPALMIGGELSGHAITSPGVRTLTPLFNVTGVLLLVGGAVYSAWIFYRKRVLLDRVIGNILIAVGAMAPAFGGALQRAHVPLALYLGELLGAALMFAGFLKVTQSAPAPAAVRRAEAVA